MNYKRVIVHVVEAQPVIVYNVVEKDDDNSYIFEASAGVSYEFPKRHVAMIVRERY